PVTLCLGSIKITGDPNALMNAPVTSARGEFTAIRLGSPIGCSVSVSSSAGGRPATVVFQ
ncbi:MAG: hypothetical protein ACREJM_01915, partial [Candidatus Saccharimonadales bacterium]